MKLSINQSTILFLPPLCQDKTQMTMLVTWMIELFLNQLGELKETGHDDTSEYEHTQEEFRAFLGQPRVKVSD